MKFYIKQKAFSFKDKFTIKDENGKDVFQLQGKVFSVHNKINFMNMQEEVLLKIHKKAISFLPKYFIDDERDENLAIVQRKMAFFKSKFEIQFGSRALTVTGNVWQHNFDIEEDGKDVATISKKILSFGDSYEIDIIDEDITNILLAIVIIIDQILHEDKNRRN